MLRRNAVLVAVLALALLAPATASAGWLPSTALTGPSADIKGQGEIDLDLAPDGTGAVVLIRKATDSDGQRRDHVFIRRRSADGTWSALARIDLGRTKPARWPMVAAGNGGRLVVAWLQDEVADDVLMAARSTGTGQGFLYTDPIVGDPAVSAYDLAMAPGGQAWATMTVVGSPQLDVKAARLQSDNKTWLLSGALDAGSANAGGPMQEPQVAVFTGGAAFVSWSQGDPGDLQDVYVRRLTGPTPTFATPPLKASVASVGGHPRANDAFTADVDTGDGGAWVVFRESFDYNGTQRPRMLARRLNTSAGLLGNVRRIDNLPSPLTEGAEQPQLSINDAGNGLFTSYGQLDPLQSMVARLTTGTLAIGPTIDPGDGSVPFTVPAIAGARNVGIVAFAKGGAIRARSYTGGAFNAASTRSIASLGEAEVGSVRGLQADADAPGNALIAFVQRNASNQRSVVVARWEPPPP